MKLINSSENSPEIFYIFVNQFNLMTEHNYKLTKTFCSGAVTSCSISKEFAIKFISGKANYLPYEPCGCDNVSPSPYLLSAINDYRIEYDAEVFRENNYSLYPSRLSALYAFGDLESCNIVSEKYHWDINSVKKFKLKDWPLTRIAKVNMEHVLLLRHAYRIAKMQDIDHLWDKYWSGFGEICLELPSKGFTREQYKSGVIWEYLIEGIVENFD
jgi:hypothetical protein